jgi:acyl-CoA thioesterase-1
MLAPPNYGADYATRFNAIYPELAKQYEVPLYPFFLDGVAADATLNQADGMHPTAEGVATIVTRILPSVEALLATVKAKGS